MKPLFLIIIFFLFSSCHNENSQKEFPYNEITISELRKGYSNGEFTVYDVISAYIKRINEIDQSGPKLNSIIEINPDALKIAKQLDVELSSGNIRGKLHGIPVILKDNIDAADKMSTTAGSRAMIGSNPLKDSFLVKKYPTAEKSETVLELQTCHSPLNFDSGFNDKFLSTFIILISLLL